MEQGQDAIAKAINTWTINRSNANILLGFLNQGYNFEITREEFNRWSNLNPKYIHAYPAVFDGVLNFVVVDSVTDANRTINYSFVFTKRYTYGALEALQIDFPGESNITILDGLERVFRWLMNKPAAVNKIVKSENGIFQAFRIPFADLQNLFSKTSGDKVYALLGLKSDDTPDLILWNEIQNFVDPAMVEDTVVPVPPFYVANPVTDYQLLVQS